MKEWPRRCFIAASALRSRAVMDAARALNTTLPLESNVRTSGKPASSKHLFSSGIFAFIGVTALRKAAERGLARILPGRSADGPRQDVWLHRKRLGGLDVGGLVHAGGMTTTARDQAGRLADLLRRERAEMAEFLLALAEFDKERGWIELGHTSL